MFSAALVLPLSFEIQGADGLRQNTPSDPALKVINALPRFKVDSRD